MASSEAPVKNAMRKAILRELELLERTGDGCKALESAGEISHQETPWASQQAPNKSI